MRAQQCTGQVSAPKRSALSLKSSIASFDFPLIWSWRAALWICPTLVVGSATAARTVVIASSPRPSASSTCALVESVLKFSSPTNGRSIAACAHPSAFCMYSSFSRQFCRQYWAALVQPCQLKPGLPAQVLVDARDVEVDQVGHGDRERDAQVLPLERDRGAVGLAIEEVVGQPLAERRLLGLGGDAERVLLLVVEEAAPRARVLGEDDRPLLLAAGSCAGRSGRPAASCPAPTRRATR